MCQPAYAHLFRSVRHWLTPQRHEEDQSRSSVPRELVHAPLPLTLPFSARVRAHWCLAHVRSLRNAVGGRRFARRHEPGKAQHQVDEREQQHEHHQRRATGPIVMITGSMLMGMYANKEILPIDDSTILC